MVLTLPSDKQFGISGTEVAFDVNNETITFWRTLDSTIRTITLSCTTEELYAKLERTRKMNDSDFSWMSTLGE